MFSNLERFEPFLPITVPDSLQDLPRELRIYHDGDLEIWFAPMGSGAVTPKIWILGITPGWNQMRIAYAGAAAALKRGASPARASAIKKPDVAFAGSMRENLVAMMDTLGFPEALGVSTCADLFGSELLRTGSVLKYPVFKAGSNYTGHAPNPGTHQALRHMLDTVLSAELKMVEPCLILPLGKAVETVLQRSVADGLLNAERILSGFPHPSGANGHRRKQFELHRKRLRSEVRQWYRNATG